jgi:arsenate reductase-like glutaredoxin family protein
MDLAEYNLVALLVDLNSQCKTSKIFSELLERPKVSVYFYDYRFQHHRAIIPKLKKNLSPLSENLFNRSGEAYKSIPALFLAKMDRDLTVADLRGCLKSIN